MRACVYQQASERASAQVVLKVQVLMVQKVLWVWKRPFSANLFSYRIKHFPAALTVCCQPQSNISICAPSISLPYSGHLFYPPGSV